MNWYLMVLKKYAQFSGRSRRSEFWYFVLFNFIISMVLGFIDGMMGMNEIGILGGIYSLGVLIPSIAVAVRRLHDTGRSGWWYLLVFTIIGIIVLIVFWAMDGQPEENEYGRNPKEEGYDVADHLVD